MKGILKYEGLKFEKGSVTKVSDPLSVEQALQISINQKPFTVVMQTPGDEFELAIGLLYAEDVLKKKYLPSYSLKENKKGIVEEIDLNIPEEFLGSGYLSARSLLSVSSCGICGKQSLEDLQIQQGELNTEYDQLKPSDLIKMQEIMFDNQINFKVSGGCHGVAAFNIEGELLILKEDIGRHNAMDKVVGSLLINNQMKMAKVISFSGRLSYELISKAFRAKIPIIIAVSSPSSLAVDFAKEYGLTLIAFSRGERMTCYAGQERIRMEQLNN